MTKPASSAWADPGVLGVPGVPGGPGGGPGAPPCGGWKSLPAHPVDLQKSTFFNAHPGSPTHRPRDPPGTPRDPPGTARAPPRYPQGPPRIRQGPPGDPQGAPREPPETPQGPQAPPGRIPGAPGDLQGKPKEPSRTSPSTPIVRTGCAWTIEWLRGWFLGPPDITWSRSGGRDVFRVRVGGIGRRPFNMN